MSTVGSFDRTKHLTELNDPLPNGAGGYTSSATRKAAARAALDVASIAEAASTLLSTLSAGVADARFVSQPLVHLAPTAHNVSATITAAQVIGGLITSTSAAAVALTLPTASDLNTQLLASHPGLANNDSILLHIRNTGPNSVTMTTNTGWTLHGDMVVETATTATYLVHRTSASAYTLDRWL